MAAPDSDTRIDAAPGERLWARFSIAGDKMTEYTGGVWLVERNLFSLEFSNPTEQSDAGGISAINNDLIPPPET